MFQKVTKCWVVVMPPAKENDAASFPSPLAPPSSACPPTMKPLCSMYRLPLTIVPTTYNIKVSFNIPSKQYRGRVITDLDILSSTQHICVNTSNLQLQDVTIEPDLGLHKPIACVEVEHNSSIGVARLDFGTSLPVGKYKLHINFTGKVRSGLQGVYVNKYIDGNGLEKEGIATMFAATEARSFFPCWDQPDVKCAFELSVLVPRAESELQVLSNMSTVAGEDAEDEVADFVTGGEQWRVWRFAKSPLMSTYLLCIVIGQYSSVSRQLGSTNISVYAPMNRAQEAAFSLDTAAKCIQIFNEFFGIEYCLPKLDLIALACLSVGAMENWGLVTFR